MHKIKVTITWLDNFGAYSEQIDGCVATADTLEGTKKEYASALEFHIQGMKEDGEEIPAYLNNYELEFELNAQALLKFLDGKLTRAAISRITGIAQKQLSHYITGHRSPRPAQREKIIKGIKKIGSEILSVV